MGWTGCDSWRSKADVLNEIVKDRRESTTWEMLDRRQGKSGLWVLVQHKTNLMVTIFYFLIESHMERGVRRYLYKDMDESMGPSDVDCPLAFIDAAEASVWPVEERDSTHLTEWRKRVRAFHEAKKRTFGIGDKVTIFGRSYTVTGKVPNSVKYLVKSADGSVYGARPEQMVPA